MADNNNSIFESVKEDLDKIHFIPEGYVATDQGLLLNQINNKLTEITLLLALMLEGDKNDKTGT